MSTALWKCCGVEVLCGLTVFMIFVSGTSFCSLSEEVLIFFTPSTRMERYVSHCESVRC